MYVVQGKTLQKIFKYIDINKHRAASISFKHLQNKYFSLKPFFILFIPNFESSGSYFNEKRREGLKRDTRKTEHAGSLIKKIIIQKCTKVTLCCVL